MAAPRMQPPGASVSTALVPAKKNILGIVTPQGLERPLSSLAEGVQKVMGSFYDVHKALLVKKTPKAGIEPFKESKHLFRTECESLRQILQSGYRHAVDFASSCQRAPNDRNISAKRCQLSGKGVLRDLQEVNKVYDQYLEAFRSQENVLKGYLVTKPPKGHSSGRRASSADDIGVQLQTTDAHPEALVTALYEALGEVQSSLRDLLAFWNNHASFLTLVVNRQSNFPAPGEETKATVEVWIRYQAALLQASASISNSADAMTVDPSIAAMNVKAIRRHTHPAPSNASPPPPASSDKRPISPMNVRSSPESMNGTGNSKGRQPSSWWRRLLEKIFSP